MAKGSKSPIPKKFIMPALLLGGLGIAGYFAYSNNMFGIKKLIKGGPAELAQQVQNAAGAVIPPQINPFAQQQGGPGGPGGPTPMDQMQPQQGFDEYDFYNNEQVFTPYTQGVGTVPGTNPSPYPQACLPGYYRASDQKCYPIPTQFPGNGCPTGEYLANDGKCYPYPNGGLGGAGGAGAMVPCPLGEYRASDGKCYSLPTAAPQTCPLGWYMASDNKCYRLDPNSTDPPSCPAGYVLGADNVCRGSTACPTGQQLENGVCKPIPNPCPTGYVLIGNMCQPSPTACPTGYHLVNGVCTPGPQPGPINTPPISPGAPLSGLPTTGLTVYRFGVTKYGSSPASWVADLRSGKIHRGAQYKWIVIGKLLPQYYNYPYTQGGHSYREMEAYYIVIAEPLTQADFVKATGKMAPGMPRLPGMYYGMRSIVEQPPRLERYVYTTPTSGSSFFGQGAMAAVIENKPRKRLNNRYR
jgi:hypothetical protein